jgi:hypothetical protein
VNPNTQPASPPPDSEQRVGNILKVMQPGETVVCDVRRHPIGIIAVYVMGIFVLIIVAILAFAVAPHFGNDANRNQITQIGALVFLFLAVLCAIYCFIATKIYWNNSWLVTSDSLTQVNQTSLFDRESSQLSLGNLEDVSAVQNGPLAHMFNYGVISAETAAATDKFTFLYCPNPNYYAQQILAAREAFEQDQRAAPPPLPPAPTAYPGEPSNPGEPPNPSY